MCPAPVNVYLTVDVECSMGGAWSDPARRPVPPDRRIFCRQGKHEWGIGFLSAELNRYGLAATFFTEMFAARIFGMDEMRRVVDVLLGGGQDVQLHLHPVFLRYAERLGRLADCSPVALPDWPDGLSCYEEEEQYRLLEQGVEIFQELLGRSPVAFRAGGYAANRASLRCLAKLGIPLDASANPACSWSFPEDSPAPNRVARLENVWEVPVTVTRTRFPDLVPLKPLEISAISFSEMRVALETAYHNNLRHVVIMFHSFSAVKASDISYNRLRPNRIVIRRFRRLLRFLADNPSLFQVSTFGQLAEVMNDLDEAVNEQTPVLPDFGRFRPVLRKAVQVINNLYWT